MLYLIQLKGKKYMDELVKYLTSKIGYTLAVIFGFALPGNALIYIWDRELYLEMDILKLLIISVGIPFMLCIPNFFVVMEIVLTKNLISKKSEDIFCVDIIACTALIFGVMEIDLAIAYKIIDNDFTAVQCLEYVVGPIVIIAILLMVVRNIISLLMMLYKKIKYKGTAAR